MDIIKKKFDTQLARNTLWEMSGYGIRIVIQGAYFILLARLLGVEQFGFFVSALALIALFAPFASIGAGNLLVMNVVRDPDTFSDYWNHAIRLTLVSGGILIIIILFGGHWFFDGRISRQVLLILAVTELWFVRLLDLSGQAFQAVEQLRVTARFNILRGVFRLLALIGFEFIFNGKSVYSWVYWYLSATAIVAFYSLLIVNRKFQPRYKNNKIFPGELKKGLYFAVGASSMNVYTNIDKAMLGRLSTIESAGIYAAAYRIIEVILMPVKALLSASYARFFKAGKIGINATLSFAWRLLPYALVYSLLAGVGIWIAADILPFLLGEDFNQSVSALRWLAVIPSIQVIHFLLADAITGADRQGLRSAAQVSVSLVNVFLNLWLIPLYSWRGAVWSTIASEVLLLGLLTIISLKILKNEKSS